ncbi:hypothetical protein GBAR_LOCUS10533 [Geodia barretti]|uniref:Uncharacterized protein n=1 Tax=Geodia barretti TaxID=519541 RepID=A0AA35WK47_GEOBA|nr:hypothetical protein GBAR_LOCUS10533 [Geodia barretti]
MVSAQRFLLLAVTMSTTALTEVMRKAASKHTNVAKESVDIFRSQLDLGLAIGLTIFFFILFCVIAPIIICVCIWLCVAGAFGAAFGGGSHRTVTTVQTTPVTMGTTPVVATTSTTGQVKTDYPPPYNTGAAYPAQSGYPAQPYPAQPGYPPQEYPPQQVAYPPPDPGYPTQASYPPQ